MIPFDPFTTPGAFEPSGPAPEDEVERVGRAGPDPGRPGTGAAETVGQGGVESSLVEYPVRPGPAFGEPGPEVGAPPAEPEPPRVGEVWQDDDESLRRPPRAVRPRPRALLPSELDAPELYFNRELSWLDFNWRVLQQSVDPRNPLLERVRFLAITQSNLDEFVRKRVGGLKRQLAAEVRSLSPDGRTPAEQLALIDAAVREMQEAMTRTWEEHLRPALNAHGITVYSYDALDGAEKERLRTYFMDRLYPVLTPLAVDPGHPFPFISNQSLSLAILLQHPERESVQFARVKVPLTWGRWIALERAGGLLPVEELVARHVDELFRGTRILSVHAFRVTRNADLSRDEEEAEDLLQMISEELRERRFAPVVRLEVSRDMPRAVIELLKEELKLGEEDVHPVDGFIDFTDLNPIADQDRPALRFAPWEPVVPAPLAHALDDVDTSIFDVLRARDVMVYHPYQSFRSSVQRFIEEAADDPRVLAIKLTLYRTSERSPIIRALVRAAEAGKQVAVLVEVTARFEEARNIEWGQLLERAGVHVTYGLLGLKTHTKVTLVVREEGEGIRLYSHVGTGNYHAATARLYSDLGLLTSSRDIGLDLVRLFHYLTGHAPEQRYRALVVAPRDMRAVFEELVEREIRIHRARGGGRIILKMNAIDDTGMIRALYRASQEGVQVDLVIRGHTRLRPGVPGISENIRVVSIIGRFLEHDRAFWFRNGGDHDVLFGSADWRRRNLEARVEAVVRITDPALKRRLYEILTMALDDNRLAWDLQPDGHYTLRTPPEGGPVRDFHRSLMRDALERRAGLGRG
ncbi:MAG: polyphosphate kinase 1 [Gemmatimonadetes bacterium]|nr:polyphosphate kinase 1 [Gemmatimonadota bacterium]